MSHNTNHQTCISCKTNPLNNTTLFCDNCWDFLNNRLTMDDFAVLIASLHHREPKNKHAEKICVYLVADNYMRGKAELK